MYTVRINYFAMESLEIPGFDWSEAVEYAEDMMDNLEVNTVEIF